MTPTRPAAAQRHSPGIGKKVRSGGGIFSLGNKKGTMSSKPSLAIKLGDLLANPKGGKFFPVCAEDGGPAVWQCDWIRILWHPTAYNGEDARRLPLCLEPNEAAAAELARFEKILVAQLASRSQADPKLFGRMLTTQDTEGRLVSCLKTSSRGNSFIKLKVCLGLDQVRLWDAQGQPLPEMGDLSNRECKVRADAEGGGAPAVPLLICPACWRRLRSPGRGLVILSFCHSVMAHQGGSLGHIFGAFWDAGRHDRTPWLCHGPRWPFRCDFAGFSGRSAMTSDPSLFRGPSWAISARILLNFGKTGHHDRMTE